MSSPQRAFHFMLIGAILALAMASICFAAVPQTMNYQGYLASSDGTPVNGTVSVVFSLYNVPTGGSALWTETQDVSANNGIYSVYLGSVTPISLPFDAQYYLGIKAGADAEMVPRQPLASTGYAMRAASAEAVSSSATLSTLNQIVSTVPTGTAPLQVASTTVVANLNADLLDGRHASDFVQKSGDTMNGTLNVPALNVSGPVQALSTWGLSARTQGLMIMPEGQVFDDGSGNITFSSTVTIMNPAGGSYFKVAAGTYTLPTWGYLYVDLPPTATRGTVVTPVVGTWNDQDRSYDNADRLVLAQRLNAGQIFTNFRVPAQTYSGSSLLVKATNLSDARNNSSITSAGTWWTIPGRTVTFTKRSSSTKLRITYQDTLGTNGMYYDGCEWQILLDGTQVAFFSAADSDDASVVWKMDNGAHIAWATAGVGNHSVSVQNRGNRGAWGAGTNECMQGWNTTTNFISVEEIQ